MLLFVLGGHSNGQTPPAPHSPSRVQEEKADPLVSSRTEEWRQRRRQKALQPTRPPQDSVLERALLFAERGGFQRILSIRYKDLYPKFGRLSPTSGLGFGARYFESELWSSGPSLETSAAASFLGYKQADLQFGRFNKIAPSLFLGPAQFGRSFTFGEQVPGQVRTFLYTDLRYRYYPREVFYGLGQDAGLERESDYLLEDGSFEVVTGHQFADWGGVAFRVGYLNTSIRRGSENDTPDVRDLFDETLAPGLTSQPDFLRFESGLFFDYRDVPGNPHQGGVLGLSWARYDDRGGDQYEFNRFSLDTRHYLPLGSRQRVLALRFYASWADSEDGSRVPFYLMETLGGNESLRGFRELRFRESNLLYYSFEYRWEAAPAFETALFYDAGKAYPEGQAFDFKHTEHTIGIGFRFKTSQRTLMRLDIGQSTEGTRVHLQFHPAF